MWWCNSIECYNAMHDDHDYYLMMKPNNKKPAAVRYFRMWNYFPLVWICPFVLEKSWLRTAQITDILSEILYFCSNSVQIPLLQAS